MTDDAGRPLAVEGSLSPEASNYNDRVLSSEGPDGPDLETDNSKWKQVLRTKRKKRLEHLDDLLRSLDIAIFCQLSTLYYLDCSLFFFAIRAIPHFVQQTPKPLDYAPPPLGNISQRPYVPTIITVNLICFLWHAFASAPSAGEATRGYLHGGLLIDFVGQAGPTSKIRLLALDILVFTLQIVMLSITQTKFDVNESLTSGHEPTSNDSGQDLDAEERGIHREGNLEVTGESGIELQNLLGSASREAYDGETSDAPLPEDEDHSRHSSESFDNGENLIAEVYTLDLIKRRLLKRGMG